MKVPVPIPLASLKIDPSGAVQASREKPRSA